MRGGSIHNKLPDYFLIPPNLDDDKRKALIAWFTEHKMGLPKTGHVFSPEAEVDFRGITTESAENITFIRTYLGNALFDGITLRSIKLNAPEWYMPKKSWWGVQRNILREEENLPKNDADEQLKKLEDQYTQLKANLEGQANYRHAGDFHFGEQEIRLRLKRDEWPVRLASHLYRFLAGYGERPVRAFVWLAVLLLITPLFLAPFDKGELMTYSPTWKGVWVWGASFIKSLLELVAPFSWQKQLHDAKDWELVYYLVLALFQLLFYVQTTLAFLALRRRFKR